VSLNKDWATYFYYDETSPSCLRWNVDRYCGKGHNRKVVSKGDVAGNLSKGRHSTWCVMLDYSNYKVHRIIYEMVVGPCGEGLVVDHFDRDAKNNLVGNLRLVTSEINSRNMKLSSRNSSGVVGVHFKSNKAGNTYWTSSYLDCGRNFTKNFSITKLGHDEAFKQACEYRVKMIEGLNNQGAGYTEHHGK
jgi:hypothetical protein